MPEARVPLKQCVLTLRLQEEIPQPPSEVGALFGMVTEEGLTCVGREGGIFFCL
ncbi:hypothetical protein AVEN_262993-1, partial [Araneus ventricosus]